MATYYIDPSSSTNGDGSLATPFNVLPTITSGNTYLFKRGTVYKNSIVVPSTAVNTTYGAYGSGDRPIISPGSLDRWSVRVSNGASYTTVQDLELTGASGNGSQTTFGAYWGTGPGSNADYGILRRCKIHDMITSNTTDCDGVQWFGDYGKIMDNEIYNIPDDGIWLQGINPYISGNYIHDVGQDSSTTGDCIQLNGACNGFVVINNVLNHSANLEKQCFIISGASTGYGGLFAYNKCSFPLDYNNSGNYCYYSDQPGARCIGNYFYGGTGGVLIDAGANQIVRSNLFVSSYIGISTANSPTGLLIDNNTIVNSLNNAAYLANGDVTTKVRQNIFYGCAKGLATHGSIFKSKNSYYKNSVYDWASIAGGGTIEGDAFLVDPSLSSVYLLNANSPLIRAGTFIDSYRDYRKKQFNNPPSIGANEDISVRGTR